MEGWEEEEGECGDERVRSSPELKRVVGSGSSGGTGFRAAVPLPTGVRCELSTLEVSRDGEGGRLPEFGGRAPRSARQASPPRGEKSGSALSGNMAIAAHPPPADEGPSIPARLQHAIAELCNQLRSLSHCIRKSSGRQCDRPFAIPRKPFTAYVQFISSSSYSFGAKTARLSCPAPL